MKRGVFLLLEAGHAQRLLHRHWALIWANEIASRLPGCVPDRLVIRAVWDVQNEDTFTLTAQASHATSLGDLSDDEQLDALLVQAFEAVPAVPILPPGTQNLRLTPRRPGAPN